MDGIARMETCAVDMQLVCNKVYNGNDDRCGYVCGKVTM